MLRLRARFPLCVRFGQARSASTNFRDLEFQSNFLAHRRIQRGLQQHAASLIFMLRKGNCRPSHVHMTSVNMGKRAACLLPFHPEESIAASIGRMRPAVTGLVRTKSAPSPKAFRKLPMSSVALSITMVASRLSSEFLIRRASSSRPVAACACPRRSHRTAVPPLVARLPGCRQTLRPYDRKGRPET